MTRRTCDQRAAAYVGRRTVEGRSVREITRCLKRHIAREVHRLVTRPSALAPAAPNYAGCAPKPDCGCV